MNSVFALWQAREERPGVRTSTVTLSSATKRLPLSLWETLAAYTAGSNLQQLPLHSMKAAAGKRKDYAHSSEYMHNQERHELQGFGSTASPATAQL
jgi:hypothetical protein